MKKPTTDRSTASKKSWETIRARKAAGLPSLRSLKPQGRKEPAPQPTDVQTINF